MRRMCHRGPWCGARRRRELSVARRRPIRSEQPEAIGSVLKGLQATRPWAAGIALGELGRRWEAVVGERLARDCRPIALEAGVLMVRASSGAWAAQVHFLAERIRGAANEVLRSEVV